MGTRALAPPHSLLRKLRIAGTPVLEYHGLALPAGAKARPYKNRFWILGAQFQDQLQQIRRQGLRVKLLSELWQEAGAVKVKGSSVVLTFDDGRASDYEVAYPLLVEAHMQAEFFLNTSNVGKPGFLTWPQVSEMQRAGMSFQSHGHEHVDLSRLPASDLREQLAKSKQMLEDRLNCSVDFLAAPYGLVNSEVIAQARSLGYQAVCTSRCLPVRARSRVLNRVPIYGYFTLREFHALLSGSPFFYGKRAAQSALKYLPKYLLLRFWPQRIAAWRLQHE